MKMSKKILIAGAILFCGLVVALAPDTSYTSTPRSSPNITCDEHPWDVLKGAYKYEILQVTDDYVIVAVWFDEKQVEPIIFQFKRKAFENPSSSSKKPGFKSALLSLD